MGRLEYTRLHDSLLAGRMPVYGRHVQTLRDEGVTAVINASAAAVIETARKHKAKIGKVYAGRNGIIGALTEDLIDTSKESARSIAALLHTPAGAFGSCRYKLKSLDESRASVLNIRSPAGSLRTNACARFTATRREKPADPETRPT